MAPGAPYRVMVADDPVVIRGPLTRLLESDPSIAEAGGAVIAQDAESSVVWGMPGAVAMAGLCSAVLPLGEITPYVCKLVMRSAA